jgi:membrane-anchored glycerophosphoryl diester phosphodiesterase (GDPDase)
MKQYNNEQLKELIGFSKFGFSISIVIVISLITWIMQNHDDKTQLFYIAFITLAVMFYVSLQLWENILK